MIATVCAVEYLRPMRGGSQSRLMRCSDGELYVVKFQNNPQGLRILANELLAALLARALGLPVAEPAIVNVPACLISGSDEMFIELAQSHTLCAPGLCFGSRYVGHSGSYSAYDFLPNALLREIEGFTDFVGMFVFDKWTCNTDGRQAVFFRRDVLSPFSVTMIDQGFCFNGTAWDFPDAPLRGFYSNPMVYEGVKGIESFNIWLDRLNEISGTVLFSMGEQIPREWYKSDLESLRCMLRRLERRRALLPDLLRSAQKALPHIFPDWPCVRSHSA